MKPFLKIAYIFTIILFSTSLYAQNLSIGIQLGKNKANFSADSLESDYNVNYNTYGLVLEYIGESIWGFQMETNYIEKGSGTTFPQTDTIISQELKLKYFEVPIIVKLKLGNPKFYACVYGGLSIGFGTEVVNTIEFKNSMVEESSSFKDIHFTPYEISLLYGADVNVAVKRIVLFGDFRIVNGFTSIFETTDGFYSNKGTQIRAGLKYQF